MEISHGFWTARNDFRTLNILLLRSHFRELQHVLLIFASKKRPLIIHISRVLPKANVSTSEKLLRSPKAQLSGHKEVIRTQRKLSGHKQHCPDTNIGYAVRKTLSGQQTSYPDTKVIQTRTCVLQKHALSGFIQSGQ